MHPGGAAPHQFALTHLAVVIDNGDFLLCDLRLAQAGVTQRAPNQVLHSIGDRLDCLGTPLSRLCPRRHLRFNPANQLLPDHMKRQFARRQPVKALLPLVDRLFANEDRMQVRNIEDSSQRDTVTAVTGMNHGVGIKRGDLFFVCFGPTVDDGGRHGPLSFRLADEVIDDERLLKRQMRGMNSDHQTRFVIGEGPAGATPDLERPRRRKQFLVIRMINPLAIDFLRRFKFLIVPQVRRRRIDQQSAEVLARGPVIATRLKILLWRDSRAEST